MSSSAAEMIGDLKTNQRQIKRNFMVAARFLKLVHQFKKTVTTPIENIKLFNRPAITPTVQITLYTHPLIKPIAEASIVTLNALTHGASSIEGLEALHRAYKTHQKLWKQESELSKALEKLMKSLSYPDKNACKASPEQMHMKSLSYPDKNACKASPEQMQRIKVLAHATQIINGLLHGFLSGLGAYTSFKHNTLNRAGIIFELAQFHKTALLCKIGNFAISSNALVQILSATTNLYSVYNGLSQTNGGKDIYVFVKDCITQSVQLLPKSKDWASETLMNRAFQYGIAQRLIDEHIDNIIQDLIFSLANGLDQSTQAIIEVTGPFIASTIVGEPYGLPVLPTQCPAPPISKWSFSAQPSCPANPLEHGHFGSIELGIHKLIQDILFRTLGIIAAKQVLAPFVGGWIQGLSLGIIQEYETYLQTRLKQPLLSNIEGFLFNANEDIQNKEIQDQIEAGKKEAKKFGKNLKTGHELLQSGKALWQYFSSPAENDPTPIESPQKTCHERFNEAVHDLGNVTGRCTYLIGYPLTTYCIAPLVKKIGYPLATRCIPPFLKTTTTFAKTVASLGPERLKLGHKRNTRLNRKYGVIKKPHIEPKHESPRLEAPPHLLCSICVSVSGL